MYSWEQQRADDKRDKQLALRASTNELKLLDELLTDLAKANKIPRWGKYSRMDLIVDALKAYKSDNFPENAENVVVVKLNSTDQATLREQQEKRIATNNRRTSYPDILTDSLRHASGKLFDQV